MELAATTLRNFERSHNRTLESRDEWKDLTCKCLMDMHKLPSELQSTGQHIALWFSVINMMWLALVLGVKEGRIWKFYNYTGKNINKLACSSWDGVRACHESSA